MGRIGGNGGFDLVGRHQPVGDTGKRPAFQLFTPDRPAVGAGTAAMMAHAAITVADDDGLGGAALAAFEQARQKIGRTPPPVDAPRLRRSDERREGKECCRTGRFRWSASLYNKNTI